MLMKATSRVVLVAASLFVPSAVLGQTKPVPPAVNVLIGNATTIDTQAEINDKFAELLTRYSDGRLKAAARHGESLGGNVQMLAALQAGSVHGMVLPSGFMSTAVPDLALFDLPFLLPGAPGGITAFAAQSQAAARMKELAEQRGVHVIGFHGIGAQSLLSRFPVNKLADIQGKKFRIIPSPPRVGAYQDWGAVPRPMELSEVYTALQQGNLDGMENPPQILFRMKFHEVARYLTITEHSTFVSATIVSKKWFDGLPKDLQEAVTRAGKDTISWADVAYTKSQNEGLEALRKTISVTTLPPAELQKMKDLARTGVWERMKSDPQRGAMVKLLEEDIARFSKK